MYLDLNLKHVMPKPLRTDFGIGVVGAGFIVRDVQLKAYADAGFKVVGITSRTPENARAVADLRGISKAYQTIEDMLQDPAVEILDIAVPPDQQLNVIRQAVEQCSHLKGILAQKPLAVSYADACEIVRLCRERGLPLAVNQNMRHDQSIRALKTILMRQYLGTNVLATIEMRAVPHWQPWAQGYERLTLLIMSVHHLDAFRYLFGEPEAIFVSARKDPRTIFPHQDGICLYVLEYADGFRASSWDDVWTGPRTAQDDLSPYIKWRVEGTAGVAQGTIGWPQYPNHSPSTLTFTSSAQPNVWMTPRWNEAWFPDAFQGPMAELMNAIATGSEPETNGEDNLKTMALVEAGYRSLKERRSVMVSEITESENPAEPEPNSEMK
ncbi:MAG: Gfo/Idh/MocA family oxidoreductase [Bryobacteraceae bacterium]